MRIGTSIGALLAAAMLASAASAQDAGSRSTREFVQAAGESDAFEIMAAQAALAQSQDPQVRTFAQQMIRDHGETSRALQDATASAGLKPPPMQMGEGQASLLGALQSARGREFDQLYWRQQALAHRAALTTEQYYAASGDVPAVQKAAGAAVPRIQSHLAMAEQMSARSGGS